MKLTYTNNLQRDAEGLTTNNTSQPAQLTEEQFRKQMRDLIDRQLALLSREPFKTNSFQNGNSSVEQNFTPDGSKREHTESSYPAKPEYSNTAKSPQLESGQIRPLLITAKPHHLTLKINKP
jgi:hypothetical protein